MEEETSFFEPGLCQPTVLCKCLKPDEESLEEAIASPRKEKILSTVARTEAYLRERRIPELIRFLLTKILAHEPDAPVVFLEKLLDNCMLFRAGYARAPVLYEKRHLEAIIKSFDPGQRGWLSAGQIRRAYATVNLTPEEVIEDRVSTTVVLNNMIRDQEQELLQLLSAGMLSNIATE